MMGDDERQPVAAVAGQARAADASDLRRALTALDQSLGEVTRPLVALRRRLDLALRENDVGQLRRLEAAVRRAMSARSAPAFDQELDLDLATALRLISDARVNRRASFSADLHRQCARAGVTPRRISDRPEEWRLGPLCVAVDRRADRATIRYARMPVVTRVACDAIAVIRACRKAAQKLDRDSMAPDTFLPVLADAYRATDNKAGQVPLAELFTAVAAQRRRIHRTYTRAQFAYDLCRLRRERKLTHEGMRIDLGVATGNLTARKSRVVWIEDPSGTGQYYSSFRLVAAPSASIRSLHGQK